MGSKDRLNLVNDTVTFLDPKPHHEQVLVPEPLAHYPFRQRVLMSDLELNWEVRDPAIQADISLQTAA